MDGKELFRRTVETIQEMHLKIGDSAGSVSLYYPFEGDFEALQKGFLVASDGQFPNMALEPMPQRVRITASQEDCARIAEMPVKDTMRDVVTMINDHASFDEFRDAIVGKYPGARFGKAGGIEFDWALSFPEEMDGDVYCISEEMGALTCHRFSREEYLEFGFALP